MVMPSLLRQGGARCHRHDQLLRLRSRVAGAYAVVNFGVRPLGALAGGALGTWIGLRPTVWIATAGALAGSLWPSPILELRELPEPEDGGG